MYGTKSAPKFLQPTRYKDTLKSKEFFFLNLQKYNWKF